MWFHLHVEDFPRYLAVAVITTLSSYWRIVSLNAAVYGSAIVAIGLMLRRRICSCFRRKNTSLLPISSCRWAGSLRLLTYNIFARPPLVHSNANDWKNERLALFENHLDDYDVIVLQEIFALGTRRQKKLRDAAYRKGFIHQAVGQLPAFLSLKFVDAGLLVLSRYPIVARDSYVYRAGFQIDSYAAKQVVYARIQPPAGPAYHIFTTHLQASYKYNNEALNSLNDTARLQQIAEMGVFIRSKLQECGLSGPVMVAGDLNVNARPYSPHYQPDCGVSEEYQSMIHILAESSGMFVRDILLETNPGGHPITYGDVLVDSHGGMRPTDTVLTAPEDHCSMLCLDYILLLERAEEEGAAPVATRIKTITSTPQERDTSIMSATRQTMVTDTRVEKFEVSAGAHPFGYLSDHYGVSTVVCAALE